MGDFRRRRWRQMIFITRQKEGEMKRTTMMMRLVCMAVLLGVVTASATTYEWTGAAGNGLWTDSDNWVQSGYPASGHDVVFPASGVYTAGVLLNGNQVCNSITISGGGGFTLGPAGDTLTVQSGSISRNFNTTAQHIIAVNLQLNAPDGTNTIEVTHGRNVNAPTQQVRINGVITSSGILRKIGANGKLTLANAGNSFGGGPRIEAGELEINGVSAYGALGAHDITLADSAILYFRGLDHTVTNRMFVTGSGNKYVAVYGASVTLAGDIDVSAGSTLYFGNTGSSLFILANEITGTGNLDIFRSGVAFHDTSQFTEGNLFVGSLSGNVILDAISWSTFTNYFHNGYGAGARQWRIGGSGGLAARGTPLIIEGSGPIGGGADAKTWFNADRSFGGSQEQDNRTRLYANARVEVNVDTELTGRRVWYSSGVGPGLTGTHDETGVNRINGNITDQVAAGTGMSRGGLRMEGYFNNDELVLAGTNDWTGSSVLISLENSSVSLNTGPGGLALNAASSQQMYLRFDGNESLPRGNSGSNAWLAAASRGTGISVGYLLTGKPGGESYQLPSGYRFVLGNNNGGTIGVLGASGEAGTRATLEGSSVGLHSALAGDAGNLHLVVRGASEFELGAAGKPVVLTPTYGFEAANPTHTTGNDTGIAGAATAIQDATGTRTIRTRGDGTVVLRNVNYRTLDGVTDRSSQFTWRVGPLAVATVFAGALRETGSDLSNSTQGFPLFLDGGVLELGAADFVRNISATPAAGEVAFGNSGGFSAHGADRLVNLSGGAALLWDGGAYPHSNFPYIFGSRTANATVEFLNPIQLSTGTRRFATVRGTGVGPEGRLNGLLSGSSTIEINALTTAAGEPIPAGRLAFAHAANTFTGPVNINAGTLVVSGAISSGSAIVTVNAGGTLGGGGTIVRPVVVKAGGRLAPGNLEIGTLTVTGNLTLEQGAIYQMETDGTLADKVVVSGTLSLPAVATVEVEAGQLELAGNFVLIEAGGTTGASDLSGWTVTRDGEPTGYEMVIDGNNLVLVVPPPKGTVIMIQ